MRRRAFIAGLVCTAAISCAKAQQMGKIYRIAIAHPSYPASEMNEASGRLPWFPAFFAELRRLGYVEGQNLRVERYSAEGRTAQYADLAREVVSRRPDVILSGKNDMILFLKAATPTIPIVGISADPVAAGIVPSLARPGGNITGVSVDAGLEVWGKRLELLKQAIPGLSRVGFLAERELWDRSTERPFGRLRNVQASTLLGRSFMVLFRSRSIAASSRRLRVQAGKRSSRAIRARTSQTASLSPSWQRLPAFRRCTPIRSSSLPAD